MTISSFDAAKKICELGEWKITNLKLQKILYLVHLVYVGRNRGLPFIDESFEAWDYGPVAPELYHKVKCFGSGNVENIFHGSGVLESGDSQIISEVCDSLKDKTAAQLVEITHRKDGAWYKTYSANKKSLKIETNDILAEYDAFSK